MFRSVFNIKFSIVILFALFSASVLAELNPRDAKIAEFIRSGDLVQLKTAAKRISETKADDPELIDLATEVLLRMHEDAYPSQIDTLSWLARAIGQTKNGRYHSALTTVVETNSNKKLSSHTKKALKVLGESSGEQYAQGMAKLPKALYAKESDDTRDKRILSLMLEGDLVSLKRGVRTIVDRKVQTVKVTDTAAEILLQLYEQAYDSQIETLAWTARALGQSTTGRYHDVLSTVAANGAHKKLRSHAKKALKVHGGAQGQQYSRGLISIPKSEYDY